MIDYLNPKVYCLLTFFASAFFLLSEPRSNDITRLQLKKNLQTRLLISLSDEQIDNIFKKYDVKQTGYINTRLFVMDLFNADHKASDLSLSVEGSHTANASKARAGAIEVARVSYDRIFTGLRQPPNHPSLDAPNMQLRDLEKKIRDKIVERSSMKCNYVLTLRRCFGDSRNIHDAKDEGISRDQMRYTLWEKFQIPATENHIDMLFAKYDRSGLGRIPLQNFVAGIIREHEANEPLIDNPIDETRDAVGQRPSEVSCVVFFRSKLLERMHREGRTPHDLLHGTGRMSKEALSQFMLRKLRCSPSDKFLDEVAKLYAPSFASSGGLIDVRRLIYDAMSFNDGGRRTTPDRTVFGGQFTSLQELPSCVRGTHYSPAQIEDMLRYKCSERIKHKSPLSHLQRLFRQESGHENLITRASLRKILSTFDVLVRPDDFDEFYKKHDRGDGFIDLQTFLGRLFPPANASDNPFNPKEPSVLQQHIKVAQQLGAITGKYRVMSSLTGTRPMHNYQIPDPRDIDHYPNAQGESAAGPEDVRIVPSTTYSTTGPVGPSTYSHSQYEFPHRPSVSSPYLMQRHSPHPPTTPQPSAQSSAHSSSTLQVVTGAANYERPHPPASPRPHSSASYYVQRDPNPASVDLHRPASDIDYFRHSPPPIVRAPDYRRTTTDSPLRPNSARGAERIEQHYTTSENKNIFRPGSAKPETTASRGEDLLKKMDIRREADSRSTSSAALRSVPFRRHMTRGPATFRTPEPANAASPRPKSAPVSRQLQYHSLVNSELSKDKQIASATVESLSARDANASWDIAMIQRPASSATVDLRTFPYTYGEGSTNRTEEAQHNTVNNDVDEKHYEKIPSRNEKIHKASAKSLTARQIKIPRMNVLTKKSSVVIRRPIVNPYNRTMLKRYAISVRHTKTAHEEYGLFIKNIQNALHSRKIVDAKKTHAGLNERQRQVGK